MASLQPKNSGGPIIKFWDAPETITALEHVKGWMSKHAKKVRKFNKNVFVLTQKKCRLNFPSEMVEL